MRLRSKSKEADSPSSDDATTAHGPTTTSLTAGNRGWPDFVPVQDRPVAVAMSSSSTLFNPARVWNVPHLYPGIGVPDLCAADWHSLPLQTEKKAKDPDYTVAGFNILDGFLDLTPAARRATCGALIQQMHTVPSVDVAHSYFYDLNESRNRRNSPACKRAKTMHANDDGEEEAEDVIKLDWQGGRTFVFFDVDDDGTRRVVRKSPSKVRTGEIVYVVNSGVVKNEPEVMAGKYFRRFKVTKKSDDGTGEVLVKDLKAPDLVGDGDFAFVHIVPCTVLGAACWSAWPPPVTTSHSTSPSRRNASPAAPPRPLLLAPPPAVAAASGAPMADNNAAPPSTDYHLLVRRLTQLEQENSALKNLVQRENSALRGLIQQQEGRLRLLEQRLAPSSSAAPPVPAVPVSLPVPLPVAHAAVHSSSSFPQEFVGPMSAPASAEHMEMHEAGGATDPWTAAQLELQMGEWASKL